MDKKQIQTELKKMGLYAGLIDGVLGRGSMGAIDRALSAVVDDSAWADARKLVAFEQLVYMKAGLDSGEIDGLVGPQTLHNREVWANRQAKVKTNVETWRDDDKSDRPITAPKVGGVNPQKNANTNKWPHQSEMTSFYGNVGTSQVQMETPFPFRLAWEPSTIVHRFSCHTKVHDSMKRIWERVLKDYGYEEIKKLRLDMFGGCLNVRKMRGGSSWSMHSWGAAMDVDPERNQLKFHRAQATLDDAPYAKFWDAVYAEGFIGLGPEKDYDWMHFQAARL